MLPTQIFKCLLYLYISTNKKKYNLACLNKVIAYVHSFCLWDLFMLPLWLWCTYFLDFVLFHLMYFSHSAIGEHSESLPVEVYINNYAVNILIQFSCARVQETVPIETELESQDVCSLNFLKWLTYRYHVTNTGGAIITPVMAKFWFHQTFLGCQSGRQEMVHHYLIFLTPLLCSEIEYFHMLRRYWYFFLCDVFSYSLTINLLGHLSAPNWFMSIDKKLIYTSWIINIFLWALSFHLWCVWVKAVTFK